MKINLTKSNAIVVVSMLVFFAITGVYFINQSDKDKPSNAHQHASSEEQHDEKNAPTSPGGGIHGGKLFSSGNLEMEVKMVEVQGEARLQVWLLQNGRPLASDKAQVLLTLVRPEKAAENIQLIPENDYLRTNVAIDEPHVFDAQFQLKYGEQSMQASFSQEEGKITLSEEQIVASGITLENAAKARVKTAITLPGEIRFNEDKTAHIVPRLTGVVEQVAVNLGQQVKRGQLLAVIASIGLAEQRSELLAAQKRLIFSRTTYEREKKLWEEKISAEQDYQQARQAMNEAEIAFQNARQKLDVLGVGATKGGALNRYEIRAPFDGLITEKHIALGEAVAAEANIFTISDLSTVWAEIVVSAKDLNLVRIGEKVKINATAFESTASGTISYVGALLGEQTRAAKARVTLANPDMAWRPGLFVNVEVISSEIDVAVAVQPQAIQSVNDKQVIFVRIADGFLVQPVSTGRSDSQKIEIVKGLRAGMQYVNEGSFVLKSELGKSSAEHAH